MNTPVQSKKTCAIHQPNFFPWLGYFDKIARADIFILLDDVLMQKTGSNWTNRVQIAVQNKPAWTTCPIIRESGTTLIKDVLIDDRQPWRKKLLKTLEMNYKKAPNYEGAMAVLTPLVLYETDKLADFNIHAIQAFCRILDISTPMTRQSELTTEGQATEMLIHLCRGLAADAYLCGGGAQGYQEDVLFEQAGIELVYQSYQPKAYGAPDSFIPGLSVMDYLMQQAPD